jgi:glycosyltransferase involved in cell wall biosynthesis
MPIFENDISIIIPTYRYRDKVGRAVQSALASGAGEIIVIDDCSKDGTIETLSQFSDHRLIIFENQTNLGLWENHLAGLLQATKPWIKFLQADDYLTDGGLAVFADAADEDVSVVWSCPVMEEERTGERALHLKINQRWRIQSQDVFALCRKVGWLLGRPSDVLIRADCIEHDPAVWVTEVSADLVVGIVAATLGDVILLPAGNIVNVNHDEQDTRTQGAGKSLVRMVQSGSILLVQNKAEIVRFAREWAAINLKVAAKCALKGLYCREISVQNACALLLRYAQIAATAYLDPKSRDLILAARRYRNALTGNPDIDHLLAQNEICQGSVRIQRQKVS